ncbi:MAG: ATP-binding protein [Nitrospirae bacterium]|nr:MAG: ATP-binding protein [Nitrospirota bacterium]
MKNISFEELNSILARGAFDELTGRLESETLECKRAPYQLDHERQKLELAKDVSALANVSGGYILIGPQTDKCASQRLADEIKEISRFEANLVNEERYHQVLNEWIYPRINGVAIKWHPSVDDSTKGIVAIAVPSQPNHSKPFLITKTLDEESGKTTQLIFGYAERRRSNAEPTSIEAIHAILRDGNLYRPLMEKLDAIGEAVQATQRQQLEIIGSRQPLALPTRPSPVELLDGRIGIVLGELELGPLHPTYVLAAAPLEPLEFPSIFESSDTELARLIESPLKIRRSGFDITVGEPTRIVAGERLRTLLTKSGTLNLWADGTAIFAAPGDDFLSWGRSLDIGPPLRINTLALAESAYIFCDLIQKAFGHAISHPRTVHYRLEIKNMTINQTPAILIPAPVTSTDWTFGHKLHEAPGASKVIDVRWSEPTLDPGIISFKLISALYAWFSIPEDKIPYSERAGSNRVISLEEIRRLNPG